jgi:crotonobetainyl-CoA:carnitine CoA-transferase CaiB-like acyl-CoA transferase
MSGPLKGVRVLDFTAVVSGPFATMFLADQGAEVLKIEPIGGDSTRRSRIAIDKAGEFSALFVSSNRGKRSLSIDMKSDAGREVLGKLVAQSDVLVQNFRPGTMESATFRARATSRTPLPRCANRTAPQCPHT